MISGSCHCGKSTFRLEAGVPQLLTRCTCSFCSRRGVIWAYFEPAQFQLTSAADDGATYRSNTKLVAHYFRPVCGCRTFTDSPAFELDCSCDNQMLRTASMRDCSTTLTLLVRPLLWLTEKSLVVFVICDKLSNCFNPVTPPGQMVQPSVTWSWLKECTTPA